MTQAPAGLQPQLPPIDPNTLFLPPGVHACTLAEFEYTFVDCAPNVDHRRKRFSALRLFIDVVDDLLPDSTLWLDGGFVSHKSAAPFDIDVLVKTKPTHWAALNRTMQAEIQALMAWVRAGQQGSEPKMPTYTTFGGLQTHQNVKVGSTPYPRIQPYGGYLDTFFVPADARAVLNNFERWWKTDFATGTSKGFVEVKPDGR
jgi:hypothetical protein